MSVNNQDVFYNTQWQHFEINEDNVRVAPFPYKEIRFPDAQNKDFLTVALSRMDRHIRIFDIPEVDITRLSTDKPIATINAHVMNLLQVDYIFFWPFSEMVYAEYVSQNIASYYSKIRQSRAFTDALKTKKLPIDWDMVQRRDGEIIFLNDFWCNSNGMKLTVGVSSKFVAIYNSCERKVSKLNEEYMYMLLESLYLNDKLMSHYFSEADIGEIGSMYRMVRRTLFECALDSKRGRI